MAKLYTVTWADYDVGPLSQANIADLRSSVRRAAKTANQRLLRLERAGLTKTAYKAAMADLDGRRRFKENTKNLTQSELRHEYAILRNFISSKTSTVQGQKGTDEKRYQHAVELGYEGTMEEFYNDVEKMFTEQTEALFSSDVLYDAILTGHTDVVAKIVERSRNRESFDPRGRALMSYLKATKYTSQRRR